MKESIAVYCELTTLVKYSYSGTVVLHVSAVHNQVYSLYSLKYHMCKVMHQAAIVEGLGLKSPRFLRANVKSLVNAGP